VREVGDWTRRRNLLFHWASLSPSRQWDPNHQRNKKDQGELPPLVVQWGALAHRMVDSHLGSVSRNQGHAQSKATKMEFTRPIVFIFQRVVCSLYPSPFASGVCWVPWEEARIDRTLPSCISCVVFFVGMIKGGSGPSDLGVPKIGTREAELGERKVRGPRWSMHVTHPLLFIFIPLACQRLMALGIEESSVYNIASIRSGQESAANETRPRGSESEGQEKSLLDSHEDPLLCFSCVGIF
jgi:hypothetical protein